MSKIEITQTKPSFQDFISFRADCGWGTLTPDTARQTLTGGTFTITATVDTTLAGFGRIVGDGVLYFYLQDIIVHPKFRGLGVGAKIVETLVQEAKTRAHKGATIGLMSAHGKEGFYRKFGFEMRPTDTLGAGMTLFVLD